MMSIGDGKASLVAILKISVLVFIFENLVQTKMHHGS